MSLRAKLISLILIFVVPTVALTMIFYSRMVDEYRKQTVDYQTSSLNMLSGMLKLLENDARASLESAGLVNEYLNNRADCDQYLSRLVEEEAVFEHLIVSDLKGNVVCSDKGFSAGQERIVLPSYKEFSESDVYFFDEIAAVADNQNTILYGAIPTRNENYEVSGVLTGVLSSERIAKTLARVQLPENTEVYLFDTAGKLVYPETIMDSRNANQLAEKVTELASSRQLTRQKISLISKNVQHDFWLVPQGSTPKFILAVGFLEGNYINNAVQFTSGNIALIALLTLAFLILAYTSVELTFSKPMAQLTRTANRLAEGKLDSRTHLGNKKDEIGELASILDRMASSLEENRVIIETETSAKQASQEKFYRLFDDSLLGIFQVSPDGFLVESNPAMARMFGYKSSDDILKQMTEKTRILFVNEADNQLITQKINDRQPVHFETRFRKVNGTSFVGDLHMWGVWNAAGQLESMEGFLEDITEKRAAQSQIIKLSQAVEQNPIGIVISNGDSLIEYANHGCLDIFGYTPGEMIGQSIRTLVPSTTSPEELELIRNTLKSGEAYRGETQNTKKNGDIFWERFVASPIHNNTDETPNTLILLEDITEQYSNRARITQQVEELSALRTIDLAISSNLDLKATLNIIGNLALKHLRTDAVSIELYDSQFNMLHTAVQSGFELVIPEDVPFPVAADLTDWELVEEFSIHIPEKLFERRTGSRLSFPQEDQFNACFGLPLVAKAEVKGLFRVYLKEPLTPEQHWLDFFYNLAAQTAIALDNFEMLRSLKQSNTDLLEATETTIEGWSKALNYRDAETEEHSERTTRWTIELAREMGYSEDDLVYIRRGALLHDIGKVAVPDAILNKPGPLTDEEWVYMRRHPVAAYEVLSPIKFLKKSLDIPYCHHERWDGSGYPRGLAADEIPLAARIFSVIDVYDALSTDRPYRKAWPQEKVISYLRENKGIQFDPNVVDQFLALLDKQKESKSENPNEVSP
jgi:PAS domain S-box-containing protein/putative nucleotidyltransferase with HDIG domain